VQLKIKTGLRIKFIQQIGAEIIKKEKGKSSTVDAWAYNLMSIILYTAGLD
jgi:hypothetical protein